MKLARYTHHGRTTIGAVVDDQVIEIATLDPAAPRTIRELLAAGPADRTRIVEALKAALRGTPLTQVRLEAPIPDAQKYLAIGMNYHDHAEEAARAGVPVPKNQLWFNKQVSCITGPFDPIYKRPRWASSSAGAAATSAWTTRAASSAATSSPTT
jgi:2-keto-4-pentenoate hydratase/2-oxohepta-3-ene-1,7-dioic acid hydratase in catechol pathway